MKTLTSNRALVLVAVIRFVALPVLGLAKDFAKEWYITRAGRIAENQKREAEKEKRKAEMLERRAVREHELQRKKLELEVLRAKLELGRQNDNDCFAPTANRGKHQITLPADHLLPC